MFDTSEVKMIEVGFSKCFCIVIQDPDDLNVHESIIMTTRARNSDHAEKIFLPHISKEHTDIRDYAEHRGCNIILIELKL